MSYCTDCATAFPNDEYLPEHLCVNGRTESRDRIAKIESENAKLRETLDTIANANAMDPGVMRAVARQAIRTAPSRVATPAPTGEAEANLREAWIAARQVVFAARAVLDAFDEEDEPHIDDHQSAALRDLRETATAYDQRNHDRATPAPTGEADDLLSDDDRMEAAIDAYNECDRPEADESARTFQRRRMRTAFRALLARATPPAAPAAVTDDDITRALEAWHESDASEDQDRAAMRLVLTRFAASITAAASQPPQEH